MPIDGYLRYMQAQGKLMLEFSKQKIATINFKVPESYIIMIRNI